MADDSLVALISAALAANDPLDPWLAQSNYDENYWDDIAAEVAPTVAAASSERIVRKALTRATSKLATGRYARKRIRAAAHDIWTRR